MSPSHSPRFLPLLLPLLFLLPGSATPHQQPISMDPHEKEALFQLMEAVSSNESWRLSHPDPCASPWPGLECTTTAHVTRLHFGNHPYPTCSPDATFPTSVFLLSHLQSLFFFACFRETNTTLSIPASLPSPSSLQQLSLKSNPALVGAIPARISSLQSLQVLTLSQNRLSGSIPEAVLSLPSLVHLDLSYNSLTGVIPPHLGTTLRNLAGLDLSYNRLTGPIPASIGQMGLLQKLDLSSNSLTGTIPDSLCNLKLLAFMALSNNRLHGPFPVALPKLQALQYLILEGNPMGTPLPQALGSLGRLQELRLGSSAYVGRIPCTLGGLRNLTTLSLENNRLTGEIPAALAAMGRVYYLNLSRNMLGGEVPFGAEFVLRLRRNLDLSGNQGLCFRSGSLAVEEGVEVGVLRVCGADGGVVSAVRKPLREWSGGASPWPLCHRVLCYVCALLGLYMPLLFSL